MTTYIPRFADRVMVEYLAGLPAVMVVGPRATGKTTTARRYADSVVRMDRPAEAAAFRADPDAALRALPGTVLLDEWQEVPDVLGAVKRAVDDGAPAGRIILTGSVRADLSSATWPGTGRVVRVWMDGLSRRELARTADQPSLIGSLSTGSTAGIVIPRDPPDLVTYIDMALTGGFPEAVLLDDPVLRAAWLDGYLSQVLTRDAAAVADRDPDRMGRYFEALALNSGGVPAHQTLYEAAGISRNTAVEYDRLLLNLMVTHQLPAWSSNRLKRLVKSSKRLVSDPSLIAASLRLNRAGILRDGDLLGRMLETFVVAQIRAEAAVDPNGPRLFHLRTHDGRHEVDLIAEMPGGAIVGLEVKASATPTRRDAAHLVWLRDQLGDRFAGGAVLHTGPTIFQLDDKVQAIPIAGVWG